MPSGHHHLIPRRTPHLLADRPSSLASPVAARSPSSDLSILALHGQWWYSQLGPPSLTAPALLVLIRMTAPHHAIPTPPDLYALLYTIAAPFPSAMTPLRILHTRAITAPFSSLFPSAAFHFLLFPAPPELTAPLPPHFLLFGRVLLVPLPCTLSSSLSSPQLTEPPHTEDVYIVKVALSRAPVDIQGSIFAFTSSLLGWHTSA